MIHIKFLFLFTVFLAVLPVSKAQSTDTSTRQINGQIYSFQVASNQSEIDHFSDPDDLNNDLEESHTKKRIPKYFYGYIDRTHSFSESAKHVAAIYALSWIVYPITQPDTVRKKGSFGKYKDNFGKLVFDRDEPFWNWFVHPISGSQLYLYYRANGYNRVDSLGMAFISSALFEFTVEVYTEPASIQDLYQTPVLGSVLGVGLENLSMYLLNTGNMMGKILGHIINPATLFWFYEGKVQLLPEYNFKNSGSLTLVVNY